MITITNIADFGFYEREALIALLQAWQKGGLPKDFEADGVVPMQNTDSGNVFLTNDNYDVAMINNDTGKLESFYTTPNEGREGFYNDLIMGSADMCEEDQEFMRRLLENRGKDIKEELK